MTAGAELMGSAPAFLARRARKLCVLRERNVCHPFCRR
jgi:hypothetical protein